MYPKTPVSRNTIVVIGISSNPRRVQRLPAQSTWPSVASASFFHQQRRSSILESDAERCVVSSASQPPQLKGNLHRLFYCQTSTRRGEAGGIHPRAFASGVCERQESPIDPGRC